MRVSVQENKKDKICFSNKIRNTQKFQCLFSPCVMLYNLDGIEACNYNFSATETPGNK